MSRGIAAVVAIAVAAAVIAIVSGGGSDSVRTVTTTVVTTAPIAPPLMPAVNGVRFRSPTKAKGVYGTVSVQRAGSSRKRLELVVTLLVLKGHYGVALWSNRSHQRHLYEGYPGGESSQTIFITRRELRRYRWLDVGRPVVRGRRVSVRHLLRVRTSKLTPAG
jgi:hypothetical protein